MSCLNDMIKDEQIAYLKKQVEEKDQEIAMLIKQMMKFYKEKNEENEKKDAISTLKKELLQYQEEEIIILKQKILKYQEEKNV